MDRFLSNYQLRLDAKGRVSIPAPFRAVLARDGFEGLYCYPTLDRPALDAGGNALLAEIEALIARFFALFGGARTVFGSALFDQRDPQDRQRGQGGALGTAQDARRDHRRSVVRRSWPQVSDLGARPLSRGTRGGHREGPRAQAAAGLPGRGRRVRTEHGNDGGQRQHHTCCRWRTGSSHSRARPPPQSSFWACAMTASMSTLPSVPADMRA